MNFILFFYFIVCYDSWKCKFEFFPLFSASVILEIKGEKKCAKRNEFNGFVNGENEGKKCLGWKNVNANVELLMTSWKCLENNYDGDGEVWKKG